MTITEHTPADFAREKGNTSLLQPEAVHGDNELISQGKTQPEAVQDNMNTAATMVDTAETEGTSKDMSIDSTKVADECNKGPHIHGEGTAGTISVSKFFKKLDLINKRHGTSGADQIEKSAEKEDQYSEKKNAFDHQGGLIPKDMACLIQDSNCGTNADIDSNVAEHEPQFADREHTAPKVQQLHVKDHSSEEQSKAQQLSENGQHRQNLSHQGDESLPHNPSEPTTSGTPSEASGAATVGASNLPCDKHNEKDVNMCHPQGDQQTGAVTNIQQAVKQIMLRFEEQPVTQLKAVDQTGAAMNNQQVVEEKGMCSKGRLENDSKQLKLPS